MDPFPTLDETEAKLSAIKEQIDSLRGRIKFLERQKRRDRREADRAQLRNEKKSLQQANHRLQRRKESLQRARSALKQLKASRVALEQRVEAGKQQMKKFDLSVAHLNPFDKRKLSEELRGEGFFDEKK